MSMSQSNEQKLEQKIQEVEENDEYSSGIPKNSRKTQAVLLLELVEEKGITLFHNELKEPFVVMPMNEHQEVWFSRSRMFKRWLAKEFWDAYGKTINSDALNSALNTLEGRACFEGCENRLTNRVAWSENAIWYDLTNPEWSAVKIDENGWQVVKKPPILFRRYTHQQAQVIPVSGGNAEKICEFVNIKTEGQKLLFMVYLVSCFIPGFPHPVLSVYGAQGSAKSMLCKFSRKLTDPSSIEVASFPKDINELAQLLAHHWCIFFDNVSVLPGWISDMLCKAVSGDGFSKRELYSDDDDVIFSFRRCLGINGINLVVSKPDLLERSILLELERVPRGERKQEKELLEKFEEQRPYILGGIMDTVVKALKIRPTITLAELPRMADFAVWGCAIAEALGHTQQEFIQAYYENIDHQNEQVLGESLIATAVRAMLKNQAEWEGTPSELLDKLTIVAKEQGINTERERDWPKAANTLSRRLNELKTNLAVDDIQFRRVLKDKKRFISLQSHQKNTVESVVSSFGEMVEREKINNSTDDKAMQLLPLSTIENSPALKQKNDSDDGSDTLASILEL